MPLSVQGSRLGINLVLTNLAQGVIQPEFVMRLLYPLVEVADYGGQTVEFDDSDYLEVRDDRDDDTPYAEIQDSYFGRPFTLNTKGLSYRVGDKKANAMNVLRINWGQRAANRLIKRGGLMHEIEAAVAATTPARYDPANRITLTTGGQFNNAGVDPDPIIRTGKSVVAGQIGVDPNVMLLGREVFDTLASRYSTTFTSTNTSPGLRDQLTEEKLAAIYGFQRVRVCNALRKVNGARQRIFGKHLVMGYTNPAALNGDTIPFKTGGAVDFEEPSYGYTYVYRGNPLMYNPYYDNDRGSTVYKMDFDRKVVQTGVNKDTSLITHGYAVFNAVA
jgi:hypothetical protein